MSNLETVVRILYNHINGRIHPDQIVIPEKLYEKAIEEQSDNCKKPHAVYCLVKDGLNVEHFLCCGVPVIKGGKELDGAIIIFYNGVSKFEKIVPVVRGV